MYWALNPETVISFTCVVRWPEEYYGMVRYGRYTVLHTVATVYYATCIGIKEISFFYNVRNYSSNLVRNLFLKQFFSKRPEKASIVSLGRWKLKMIFLTCHGNPNKFPNHPASHVLNFDVPGGLSHVLLYCRTFWNIPTVLHYYGCPN